MEQVKEFYYLGSMISDYARCHREIKILAMGKKANAEWIWRMMEKISWTAHISKEKMLKLTEEERSLLTTIRTRKQCWMGHMTRGDSLPSCRV